MPISSPAARACSALNCFFSVIRPAYRCASPCTASRDTGFAPGPSCRGIRSGSKLIESLDMAQDALESAGDSLHANAAFCPSRGAAPAFA
jgi:hypothetical protein